LVSPARTDQAVPPIAMPTRIITNILRITPPQRRLLSWF
jgi:hypothetical protein